MSAPFSHQSKPRSSPHPLELSLGSSIRPSEAQMTRAASRGNCTQANACLSPIKNFAWLIIQWYFELWVYIDIVFYLYFFSLFFSLLLILRLWRPLSLSFLSPSSSIDLERLFSLSLLLAPLCLSSSFFEVSLPECFFLLLALSYSLLLSLTLPT